MDVKSTFNETNLIRNAQIELSYDEKAYHFLMPTMADSFDNLDYNWFLGYASQPFEVLWKYFKDITIAKDKYSLTMMIMHFSNEYRSIFLKYFNKYVVNFKYTDDVLYSGDSPIDSTVLNLLFNYISIAAGYKEFDDLNNSSEENLSSKTPEETAWEKKIRECESKIQQVRNKSNHDSVKIENMICSLLYDYHMTIQDVMNLNHYGLSFFAGMCTAIGYSRIEEYAYGQGNIDSEKNPYKHFMFK